MTAQFSFENRCTTLCCQARTAGHITRLAEDREAALKAMVLSSVWFMTALRAARALALPAWCIGAGAVRNLVWDRLHGYDVPSELSDLDLAYFDAAEPPGQERAHQERIERCSPGFRWEVTNQAHVHLWFERHFGHAVRPLSSLRDAVASWPEYATAVGVSLADNDEPRVVAPLGLDDLFDMRVRRNPARVSLETYRDRVASKRYVDRWPNVVVEAA